MIGVFDSGYGGLSVFKELIRSFPGYSFVYLGDNARAPYGSRSKEIIVEYTKEAVEWLFAQGAQVVVLACNTASGEALPTLLESSLSVRGQSFFPELQPGRVILGVIEPIATFLKDTVPLTERVAVIGTPSTIRSGRYKEALERQGFKHVIERATPLLAPLVETGVVRGLMAEHIVADALTPITREGIGAVVLGCTHYYFLRETIEKLYPHLKLFDASDAFPIYFKKFLSDEKALERKLERGAAPRFYTTDEADTFARFVEKTLGLAIEATRVRLT